MPGLGGKRRGHINWSCWIVLRGRATVGKGAVCAGRRLVADLNRTQGEGRATAGATRPEPVDRSIHLGADCTQLFPVHSARPARLTTAVGPPLPPSAAAAPQATHCVNVVETRPRPLQTQRLLRGVTRGRGARGRQGRQGRTPTGDGLGRYTGMSAFGGDGWAPEASGTAAAAAEVAAAQP